MPPPGASASIKWVGDRHLLVSCPPADRAGSHPAAASAIGRLGRALESRPPRGLLNVAPAEGAILLTFDGATLDPRRAERDVRALLATDPDDEPAIPARLIEIPVCYAAPHAPDIAELACHCGVTERLVAELHSGAQYTVRFLGFAPGFAYLAGLPPVLAMPRLDTPRAAVPAGSVGIADDRTGVYPRAMPGGWRLIGRTPLRLFDAARAPPALLRAGDTVRFVAIQAGEFDRLAREHV